VVLVVGSVNVRVAGMRMEHLKEMGNNQ